MFTVYLDESYGTVDAYSVAGYVATVEQWAEFEREWTELLLQEQVQYLHKADLESCEGEFKKWKTLSKEEQATNKLRVNEKACRIIKRRVNAGFGSSVVKSDWQRVDKGQWGRWLGESFYAAGVFNCMRHVGNWADKYERFEPIEYVFEKGAEGAHEVAKMLTFCEQNESRKAFYRLRGWSFAGKRDQVIKGVSYPGVIQLQAADFLAYETYRDMEHRIIGDKSRPRRGALLNLLQDPGTPHYLRYMKESNIKKTLSAWNETYL